MPFVTDEMRWDHTCGRGEEGRPRGWFTVYVAADALGRLGLHPRQAASRIDGTSPPGWWHAAGERYARGRTPLPDPARTGPGPRREYPGAGPVGRALASGHDLAAR
ncbi:hypothetical protein ACFUTV_32330 [Streptomyces sp. NPDC057298]|uniref:hypothetical protein n=1 Tax=Streptomyces sp. NPDC057298 TaxID=3346091 RepID=UPI0036320C0E